MGERVFCTLIVFLMLAKSERERDEGREGETAEVGREKRESRVHVISI